MRVSKEVRLELYSEDTLQSQLRRLMNASESEALDSSPDWVETQCGRVLSLRETTHVHSR